MAVFKMALTPQQRSWCVLEFAKTVLQLCNVLSDTCIMWNRLLTSQFWSGIMISVRMDTSVTRERDIQANHRCRRKLLIGSERPSSNTDVRPEYPFLRSQMHPFSLKSLYHFKMNLLVGGFTWCMRLKARCTVVTLFVLSNSNTHHVRCCGVSAILNYTAI